MHCVDAEDEDGQESAGYATSGKLGREVRGGGGSSYLNDVEMAVGIDCNVVSGARVLGAGSDVAGSGHLDDARMAEMKIWEVAKQRE